MLRTRNDESIVASSVCEVVGHHHSSRDLGLTIVEKADSKRRSVACGSEDRAAVKQTTMFS
jgi:hypothetical protein